MRDITLRVPDEMVHLLEEWARFIPELVILSSNETTLFEPNGLNSRMAVALKNLKERKIIRYLYDYTWIMTGIGDGALEGMNKFKSPQSFMNYLAALGVKRVPSRTTLSTWFGRVLGTYPNWEFIDTKDPLETLRRKNVFKYLLIELPRFESKES